MEAFEVSPTFLMDTGSGHDIVSSDIAAAFTKCTRAARRMCFNTTNGEIDSKFTLLMAAGALGGVSTPYIPIHSCLWGCDAGEKDSPSLGSPVCVFAWSLLGGELCP